MFAALIIDAHPEAAQQIQTALAGYGFEFTITQDPAEAINLARTATPDIILLRVELLNVSGFSVCNKLRRNDETKYIPLVMYASGVSEDVFSQHRNLKTHADEYLKLPFTPEILVTAIQGLIPLENVPQAGAHLDIDVLPADTSDMGVDFLEVDVEEVDEFELESEDDAEAEEDLFGPIGTPDALTEDSPSTQLNDATEAAFDALVEFDPAPSVDAPPASLPTFRAADHAPTDAQGDAQDDARGDARGDAQDDASIAASSAYATEYESDDPLAGFDPPSAEDSLAGMSLDEPLLGAFEPDSADFTPLDGPTGSFAPAPPSDAHAQLEERAPPEPPMPPRAPIPDGKSLQTLVGLAPPSPPPALDPTAATMPPSTGFKSQREVLQLKTQLNAKNREILDLKDELEGQQRSVLDAKHKNRELQAQIGDLEEKLLRAEEQMINARESADAVARDHGSFAQRLHVAERKHQELQQRLAQLESLAPQLEAARARVSELERQLVELDGARDQLHEAEARQREERDALVEQVRHLETQLDEAHRAIDAHRDVERRAQQALAVALRVLDGQEAAQ